MRRSGEYVRDTVTGPYAFQRGMIWVFTPLVVVFGLLVGVRPGVDVWEALVAGLASATAGIGALILCLWVFGWFRRRTMPIYAAIGSWVFAGIGIAVPRMLIFVGPASEIDVWLRLPGSILAVCVWIPAVAVAFRAFNEAMSLIARISEHRARLEHSARDPSARERIEDAAMLETLASEVLPALERLPLRVRAAKMHPTRRRLAQLSRGIRDVSTKLVRSISHQVMLPGGLAIRPATTRSFVRAVAKRALTQPATAPLAVAGLTAAATLVGLFTLGGPYLALFALAAMISWAGVLLVLKRAEDSLSRTLRTAARWLSVFAGIFFAAISVVAVLSSQLTGSPGEAFRHLITGVPLVFGNALLVVVASAVTAELGSMREHERELSHLVDVYAEQSRRRANDLRARAAMLLHGPVQGRLNSAVLTLEMAIQPGNSMNVDTLLEELERVLTSSARELETFTRDLPQRGIRAVASLLVDQWRGLVDITFYLADDVEAALDESDEGALVADLAIDTVTNTSRHGDASWAVLSFSKTDKFFRVDCQSDSAIRDLNPVNEAGLLLRVLEARGGAWALAPSTTGAHFWATVKRSDRKVESTDINFI
ncbi:hypothetical protein FHX49_001999 [Microbacterium endophyticum]|uniref:Uncharacterized protein n=1 Tax=Microbacterium endophyticum TaxID=1526412 RepID=A0A7W4V483_9MICO|nr:hypothetical protein [Microbacterium endophyticum]MBB2976424.1 hypothetical protein [Microbacterium endophyticum]NIK35870.1 hypothetical protein [Microbacterium endophyticum]